VSLSIEIKRGGRGNLQRREKKGKLGCGWNRLGARKSWNFREGQEEAHRHGVGIIGRRSKSEHGMPLVKGRRWGWRAVGRRVKSHGFARRPSKKNPLFLFFPCAVAGAAGQNEALAVHCSGAIWILYNTV
jgi:hypothetical protein